ncbi:MAG: hypothetical protein KC516_02575 [Nanoarchaeota archaeon]|nr:hypothetical protein [Nanoarchaeota archaeon]
MIKRNLNLILFFIILICLFLLTFQNFVHSGFVVEDFVDSNVSITKYLAIEFSNNLSSGIYFGNVSVLPAINLNSTGNNIGIGNSTEFYINVSSDSNTNVDFCIKANSGLTSVALDEIVLGNETYANSTSTNDSIPSLTNDVALTTNYVSSGENILPGGINYYRFWLDIPASQPSGDYNNTLSFKGIQNGLSC